ncbi:MAG: hypothetical protein EA426_17930 [Spirochaetaceae bacterium]|nr:MAG: hypothetical protein EA426_17930 [Spirochaetaceae bacterium]
MSNTARFLVSLQDDDTIVEVEANLEFRSLAALSRLPVAGGPASVAYSPDRRTIYVATRREPGITVFRAAAKDVQPEPLGRIVLTNDACYIGLDASGRFLAASYYRAGGVTIQTIDPGSGVPAGEPARYETHENAHMCRFSPDNRFLFVPHTGPNRIVRFSFDAAGAALTRLGEPVPFCRPGAGPRHMVFHPSGRFVFVSNELDSSLGLYRYAAESGELEFIDSYPTIPAGFTSPNTCAQIAITPDGGTVCVTNRGHDSLAAFAVGPAAAGAEAPTVRLIGRSPAGRVPRALCLAPDGRHVLTASQTDGTVTLHRLSGASVEPVAELAVGANPIWITPRYR